MKKGKHLSILIFCFLTIIAGPSKAQNMDNPGDYISAFNKISAEMNAKYMQYLSAAAHGRRARKVEKLRQEVLENITQSRFKMTDLPQYKGDNSLRKANIDYVQLCYQVFNEDYQKIVNMEEVAEQSVDEMQAYMLLHQKVDEKLEEGSSQLEKVIKDFASKYSVTLTDEKSALGDKMQVAGKLNKYINAIDMVFFKCNWEEGQMIKAMNDKKVSDIEQARNALDGYAKEGMQALDTLKTFEGDPSLANACRQAIQFYKNEAESDMPKLTDFYVKQNDFEKMKAAFDGNGSHSQDDVNNYNKAIKDYNAGINTFNQTNNKLNNGRAQALKNWENTEKTFSDEHMPHYR